MISSHAKTNPKKKKKRIQRNMMLQLDGMIQFFFSKWLCKFDIQLLHTHAYKRYKKKTKYRMNGKQQQQQTECFIIILKLFGK